MSLLCGARIDKDDLEESCEACPRVAFCGLKYLGLHVRHNEAVDGQCRLLLADWLMVPCLPLWCVFRTVWCPCSWRYGVRPSVGRA